MAAARRDTSPERGHIQLFCPLLLLVTVSAGQIVIHQCSFLYAGPRFALRDKAALDGMLG